MTIASPLMTAEDLLAIPEDGMDRELVRGELREREMTRRNRRHSRTEANIAGLLREWLYRQPEPRGEVLSGEAGFLLSRDPDTTVGIDVAYISADTARATPEDAALIQGAPVLAVEIVSPSDTQKDILEKISLYLEAGVKLVWIAEPVLKTVTVHQPNEVPAMFTIRQQLTAEPHLPGFSVPVAEIFGS